MEDYRTGFFGDASPRFASVRRGDGLDWQVLDGEVVVYDSARRVAHTLSGVAAAVWNALDEATDLGELAAKVSSPVQEVQESVDAMLGAGILRPRDVPSVAEPRTVLSGGLGGLFSRRVVLAGGAVGVTSLVTSVLLPSPAMAASSPPSTGTTNTGTGNHGGTGGTSSSGVVVTGAPPAGTEPSGLAFTSAPPAGTEPSGLAFTGANVVTEVGAAAAAIAVGGAVAWATRDKRPKPAPTSDAG